MDSAAAAWEKRAEEAVEAVCAAGDAAASAHEVTDGEEVIPVDVGLLLPGEKVLAAGSP